MPQLTDEQKKQYNSYRAAGMPPERALAIATQNEDNAYNPAVTEGVDNILFGNRSLTAGIIGGVKEAAFGGIREISNDMQKYGVGTALAKSPLSLIAGAGRGVGTAVGSVFETADDLTGETISQAINPAIESALQSDFAKRTADGFGKIDEAAYGIPSDILDSLNLVGWGAVVKGGTASSIRNQILNRSKSMLETGAKAGDALAPVKSSLSDFIKSPVQNTVDAGIEAAGKIVDGVKAIPEGAANVMSNAIDRKIVRTATTDTAKAEANMLDLYKKGIVPGVKKKNKTITNIENIDEAIVRSVPKLSKKYEVENIQDFAVAIGNEKKDIFAKIEEGLNTAGESGKIIDTTNIVAQLDELSLSERAKFSSPLRSAIEKAKRELTEEIDGEMKPKTISPRGAQDVIADLNSQLQSYYRGSTPGTNADVIVDTLVVNNFKKQVDDVVENLGDGTFRELKSQYADLKKMEDDVVHRAVYEAQKGSGLSDLTDIMSAGDVIAGALDPAFFARGVGQYLTKEVIKSLTSKDEMIRQMFLYGKNLPDKPVSVPVAPIVIDPGKQ